MDPVHLLKEQMNGQSLRSLARKMHISAAYLSTVMLRKKAPGPKILKYLGLEKIELPKVYREKDG
jgi:hypothetical protein